MLFGFVREQVEHEPGCLYLRSSKRTEHAEFLRKFSTCESK